MPTVTPTPPTMSPEVAIAVLFERLGHVIAGVEALSQKLDAQDRKRTAALDELESRVEKIEKQTANARWFLAGVAASGGALGGGVAAMMARALGG
jgi:hypothetical protein